jgi:hypothetical protein
MTESVRHLGRPAEDYLLGYTHDDGKWVPGLLEIVNRMQSHETWFIRALFALALAHFFGINTIADIFKIGASAAVFFGRSPIVP